MEIGSNLSESELCPPYLLAEQEEAFARDVENLQKHAKDFVDVPCPACQSKQGVPVFNKSGFRTLECPTCQMWFTSPRPSPDHLASYYRQSENYKFWATHIFPQSERARREKIGLTWLQRLTELCQTYSVNLDTFLEVGPGFGTFSKLVQDSQLFRDVILIEPTPELADACRDRGLAVINKSIEDVTLGELPEVSVAAAFEVIEHLFSPIDFLIRIRQVISHDGLLVLSCPNSAGFDIQLLKEHSLAVDAEHLNLFTPSAMRILLERSQFRVLEVATPGRLDAEFVREAALKGKVALDSFLTKVLLNDWERVGWSFQRFLAENNLSSHMWIVARPT